MCAKLSRIFSKLLRNKPIFAVASIATILLLTGLLRWIASTDFWNALASIGTIALAVMTYLTLRQNARLIEQEPRVYVSGEMYTEGSKIYTAYRVANNEFFRSYLKLTVSNLSAYPIQILEIASEIDNEYEHEYIEYFVPPQSSIEIEYASKIVYADETLILFFRYGMKARGYYYVSSSVYPLRTEIAVYKIHALSQVLSYVDETVSQFEDRRFEEAHKNLP